MDNYLKIATFLTPSLNLELFQVYQRFIEEKLGKESILIVESRSLCEQTSTSDAESISARVFDIGFMNTKSFLKLKEKTANVELLPVGAVHEHRLNSDELPIYYSDLIIHKSTAKKYKQLEDLKGCKYAFNSKDSVSGYILPLLELKKKGYNSSFFSNMLESGSHLNSIKMVREQRVECASVDSNALKFYLKSYPHAHDDFIVITSLGPLPIQPIVVKSSLPKEIKDDLSEALLSLSSTPKHCKLFSEFGIKKFTRVDEEDYQAEMDIYKSIGQQPKTPAYY